MAGLIFSLFLLFSPISAEAAPVMQEQLLAEELADPDDSSTDLADSEESPADIKQQKDTIVDHEIITTYQVIPVESDPVVLESADYMEESYYMLVIIASIMLFFLIVIMCKYIYRFFDIFI